jgi:hypothetical protein
VLALEIERDMLMARVDAIEAKVGVCEGGMKTVAKDLEKAKEEVKDDLKQIEERSENVVVYGLEEMESEDRNERKEEDLKKMKELMKEIGVENNDLELKAYRAGKRREDKRPRPMIVTIPDAETKEKTLANA